MTIEKLWKSACCGENDKLKEYYENGGKSTGDTEPSE